MKLSPLFEAANRTQVLDLVVGSFGFAVVVVALALLGLQEEVVVPVEARVLLGCLTGPVFVLSILAGLQPRSVAGTIRRAWIESIACWWALAVAMLAGLGLFAGQIALMWLATGRTLG